MDTPRGKLDFVKGSALFKKHPIRAYNELLYLVHPDVEIFIVSITKKYYKDWYPAYCSKEVYSCGLFENPFENVDEVIDYSGANMQEVDKTIECDSKDKVNFKLKINQVDEQAIWDLVEKFEAIIGYLDPKAQSVETPDVVWPGCWELTYVANYLYRELSSGRTTKLVDTYLSVLDSMVAIAEDFGTDL